MSRAGIVQANNASGIPGIRLRWRRGRWGRPQLGVDVRYLAGRGAARRWRWTTLPATVEGLRRALELRAQTIGRPLRVDARRALRVMKELAR